MHLSHAITWVWTQAQALRRQPVLAAVTAALIISIVTADLALIYYLRYRAIESVARNASNLSYVLAQETDRAFQSIHVVTQSVVERIAALGADDEARFEPRMREPAMAELLLDKISGLPHVSNLLVIDAQGRLLNRSSARPAHTLDLSERDYFMAARDGAPGALHISAPVRSGSTGEWNIVFSQKIVARDGGFLGAVAAAVKLKNIEDLYSRIVLGESGSVAIIRTDATLLVRYPRLESVIGASFAGSSIYPAIRAGTSDVVRSAGVIDGTQRIVASSNAPHFPVAMVVTSTLDDVLIEWREQVAYMAVTGIAAIAGLALLALILARNTEELASTQAKLARACEHDAAEARFSAAIGNMRQGLVMFDSADRLIVCNQQYLDLYKLPPELAAPGQPKQLLHEHRRRQKTYPRLRRRDCPTSSLNELEDGRIISVTERMMDSGEMVATHEDVTDRHKAEERILELAWHDGLTGLPNRSLFHETLRESLRDLAPGHEIAVHYLDLDRFKDVNDTLGHPVGDQLLTKVAKRLAAAISPQDVLARLGGDEFAIVQLLTHGEDDAKELARSINHRLQKPFKLGEHTVRVGSSIGISLAPRDGADADLLVKNADMALYAAKAQGRDTFRFFEREMEEAARVRVQLEAELRVALAAGQLELFYQPHVRLADNELIGFEALLRWRHPERGLLAPSAFISVAEDTGLIRPMGEWAILQACEEARRWPGDLRVAVNVSVAQLQSDTLYHCVAQALSQTGLDPQRLELEVTESVMLTGTEANIGVLSRLKQLGVTISMDDFGTGYSSLSCLRLFPFDKLKIDRTFVSELGKREDCAAIVVSAVNLATSLGMTTTAEGIETQGQLIQARLAGCTEGQGYLFGAPVPAAEVGQFYAARAAVLQDD